MTRSAGPLRPTWVGPLGLYHPGSSVLHRAPAGLKLAGLAVASVVVVLTHGVTAALVALGVAVLTHVVAGISWHRTAVGLRGVLVLAAVLAAYQSWTRSPAAGIEVAADLVTLVLLGTVLTATTRADVLLDTLGRLSRPLRHVGLAPETFALAVGLMVRTIPVLARTTHEARDAARARGLERDPKAVVVPAAIRMVAHARATGDALAARGLGED